MKTKFNNQMQELLLKGAVIVWSAEGKFQSTILIKLPKRDEEDFEYYQFQLNNQEFYLAVKRNGTKRQAVKITSDDHYEDEVASRLALKNK